jgi:predicted ATPase
MQRIHFVKINRFKGFGDEQTLHFEGLVSVIIGPNNSGKTTFLQALTLWSLGIRSWMDQKGETNSTLRQRIPINRKDIITIPINESRALWNLEGPVPIPFNITIGFWENEVIHEVGMEFIHRDSEVIYCQPLNRTAAFRPILEAAAKLRIEMMNPMSGIAAEEPSHDKLRLDFFLAEGRTSEVLRNLCFRVSTEKPNEWKEIIALMHQLFGIKVINPIINRRGLIEMNYQISSKKELEIAMSGRGQQQILLLLAWIFLHSDAVLMLDEPDAHLEILRQRQIFTLIKRLSVKNNNQLLVVSHSEVIFNEARDADFNFLIDGKSVKIDRNQDVRRLLGEFGVEHYVQARLKKQVLYLESSTDFDMLAAFAVLLNHPAKSIFESNIYVYYTQNPRPEPSILDELRQQSGFYVNPKHHFFTFRAAITNFQGLAILDGDNQNRQNESSGGLAIHFWKKYELENYFLTPEVIRTFLISKGANETEITLFEEILAQKFDLPDFNTLSIETQENLWFRLTQNIKMSDWMEDVFRIFSEKTNQKMWLRKSEFSQVISMQKIEKVDSEILFVLNQIAEIFTN